MMTKEFFHLADTFLTLKEWHFKDNDTLSQMRQLRNTNIFLSFKLTIANTKIHGNIPLNAKCLDERSAFNGVHLLRK